jgi:8-oxo-dGTP pyrophosphatase MutT (NUDIX family)/GNAT superfamily N-acetyltransferase
VATRRAKDEKQVSSVAVFNAEGKLLFGQRADTGKWTLPGGHLEPGESPVRAAVRELLEEAGLRAESLEALGSDLVTTWKGDVIRVHAYRVTVSGGQVPSAVNDPDEEMEDWEWVDPEFIPVYILENLHAKKNVTLRLLGLQDYGLSKSHPTPTFPKLGLGDNKRETPVVNTEAERKTKQMAMANLMRRAGRGQEASGITNDLSNANGASWTGPGAGTGEANPSYSEGASMRRPHNPKDINTWMGSNPGAPEATKLHEDLHQMFNRVQAKYGRMGRLIFAHNLYHSIPSQQREALRAYAIERDPSTQVNITAEGIKSRHPVPFEERMSVLLNYLNNPGERDAFHAYKNHDPATVRDFSTKMKAAHASLMASAQQAPASWTQDVQRWASGPHFKKSDAGLAAWAKRLKAYCNSGRAYKILGDEGTFQAGGCYLLADALTRHLGPGAEMVGIGSSRNPMEHVVVKVGPHYLDADGLHSEKQMLHKMKTVEGLPEPRIVPFNLEHAQKMESIHSPEQVEALRGDIGSAIGPVEAEHQLEKGELDPKLGYRFKILDENYEEPGEDHDPTVEPFNIVAHDHLGNEVGHAEVYHHDVPPLRGMMVSDVAVHPDHQRRGIATAMYRLAEEHGGDVLHPYPEQYDDGKALWAQPNRPFGKSERLMADARSRRNPHTGEQEFLLHHAVLKSSRGRVVHREASSWSPNLDDAQTSAWVPGYKVRAYYPGEEVIVDPQLNAEAEPDLQKAGVIRLEHYSPLTGLTRLQPKFQGTGAFGLHGGETQRPHRIPRTYYYFAGSEPEATFKGNGHHKYRAQLPPMARLYDIGADDLGLMQPRVKQTPQGIMHEPADLDQVERKIRKLGYWGYHNYHPAIPNAVAIFHPLQARQLTKPVLQKSEVDTLLEHPNRAERLLALKLPGVQGIHLRHAVEDPDEEVALAGMKHHLADENTLFHALTHHSPKVRRAVLDHAKLTPEHLQMALLDPDPQVSGAASIHPRLSLEQRHHLGTQPLFRMQLDAWLDLRKSNTSNDGHGDAHNTRGDLDPTPLRPEPGDIGNHADPEFMDDMQGWRPWDDPLFQAARFLAGGGREVSPNTLRGALWQEDDDHEAAALMAYHLPVTDENRRSLRAILEVASLKKFEGLEEPGVVHYDGDKIEAANHDAVPFRDSVRRANHEHQIHGVKLKGKHSAGTLLAEDPKSKLALLLKPGSGKPSPAAGVRDSKATQSQREAAFWRVAHYMGLGGDLPETQLLDIDGKDVAAIKLLPPQYRNMEKRFKENSTTVLWALNRYLKTGVLHKWAVLDWLLGNPDRHGQNLMMDNEQTPGVYLIDHGSAFAGENFRPATDKSSFIPFYLRAWSQRKFNRLSPEEKIKRMPEAGHEVEHLLADWLGHIHADELAAMIARYGIDPGPVVQRLAILKTAVLDVPVDRAINKLWVGA